jgi:outer membrane protein TolC
MRIYAYRISLVFILVLFCVSFLLSACTPSRFLPGFPTPAESVAEIKSTFKEPFGRDNHRQVTLSTSAYTLAGNRGMPVSAVLGKKTLSLEDCRRIALANNLELQVVRTAELTKRAITYSNRTKMLPHFLFSGDLSNRDNIPYSYSDIGAEQGKTPGFGQSGSVANWSVGHERSTWRYVLETRWSPMDAALGYYVTKSSLNERLKAHYQKIRTAQKLIAVVDGAFFRLLSLQQLAPMAQEVLSKRSEVATKMTEALKKGITGIEETDKAKQNEIRAKRLLAKARNNIEKQRNILASALGLSPDYCVDGGFSLIGELPAATSGLALCDTEIIALQNRPEAFEAGLNHLNSVNDLKRTIVKYFPKVSGFWRYTHDKDLYLYNKDWKETGASVYFDLVDWLSNVDENRAASSDATKTQREVGAVALGITQQVRVAALQYLDSMDDLESAKAALAGTRDVVRVAGNRVAKNDLDRLSLLDARANLLQNTLEQVRTSGEANATLAELEGAMGTNYNEPLPSQ